VPESRVELQFQNSGTQLEGGQEDWWSRWPPCHPKLEEATPKELKLAAALLPSSSSIIVFTIHHLTLIARESIYLPFVLIVVLAITSQSQDCLPAPLIRSLFDDRHRGSHVQL
jgi:hypothetical protein